MLRVYSQRVLRLKEGQHAVVANGRVLGPLDDNEGFTLEDFNLLERYSSSSYLEKITAALDKTSDEEEGKIPIFKIVKNRSLESFRIYIN